MSDSVRPLGLSLFPLGDVVATPSVLDALDRAGISAESLLNRHVAGDWGEMTENDRQMNDLAISSGGRLLSTYDLPDKVRLWIITEEDRSATTLLLPGDY